MGYVLTLTFMVFSHLDSNYNFFIRAEYVEVSSCFKRCFLADFHSSGAFSLLISVIISTSVSESAFASVLMFSLVCLVGITSFLRRSMHFLVIASCEKIEIMTIFQNICELWS